MMLPLYTNTSLPASLDNNTSALPHENYRHSMGKEVLIVSSLCHQLQIYMVNY